MDIVEHAAGDAYGQHGQFANRFVFDPARHIHHNATVQFDFVVVQDHRALAVDDVVEFVGAFVIVQLGVVNLHVVDFASRAVGLLDQTTNRAAGFSPRGDVG